MEKTKAALLDLVTFLNCPKCTGLLSDPHIVGICGHTVCKTCLTGQDACSVCGLPTTHQEIRPDHQIKNLVACTVQLKDLLFTSEREVPPHPETVQCASAEKKLPKEKLLERPHQEKPLENGAPITRTSKVPERRNKLGETPLQVASIKGNVEKVKQLLLEGANPNVRDNAGWTPLHEACNHGFLDVARLLLSGGALVDATGPDGVTCLHDAVLNGHLDIVRLLVRSGASLDARYFSSGVRTLRSLLLLEEPRVFEGELLSCNNKA